jgi:stress-induced morphogen
MSVNIRSGTSDKAAKAIVKALERYQETWPAAQIDVYRQNSVSVRIRVIDPTFSDLGRVERHDRVWEFLEQAPASAQSDVSMIVLLAPDEVSTSSANMAFENPIPSRL